ncbi:hypothetical protein MHYP_G00075840 [Metynnis hypsauchen]
MTERKKKEKKKKGQAVVNLLRTVLLLGCCRGGTSAREDDCDKTLHDRNRTRTMKIKKKPKKSFFSGALGLFRKSGAGTNGQNDDTGVQNQTSTNGHQGSSISSVKNGTERRRKVTFAADLHPIPGPSNHNDLHSKSLLESPESCVDNLKKTPIPPFSGGREQSWNKGKNPAVTPDLHKPRPGPSHTSTTTLPTRTESTGSGKLTTEHADDHLPTPSKGYRTHLCRRTPLQYRRRRRAECSTICYMKRDLDCPTSDIRTGAPPCFLQKTEASGSEKLTKGPEFSLMCCFTSFPTEPSLKTHLCRKTSLQYRRRRRAECS